MPSTGTIQQSGQVFAGLGSRWLRILSWKRPTTRFTAGLSAMLCPECQQRTQVVDSRPDAKTIRRRRRCPKGHTFSTTEVLLEAKPKPAPKPKQKSKPRKRVLYPRPAPQPTYRDDQLDSDFDSFDLRDLGLD